MPALLRRTVVLGLVLAGMVSLGACGSSDNSSSSTASTSSADTQAATADSFCSDFANVSDDINVDMTGDPSTFGDAFAQSAEALKQVQPPAQIADSWTTLTDFYSEFAKAFANSDATDSSSLDKVGEAITKLQENAKDIAAASAKIGAYAAKNC